MMIKMADFEDKDGLNIEEFINMMKALGLIPEHDQLQVCGDDENCGFNRLDIKHNSHKEKK